MTEMPNEDPIYEACRLQSFLPYRVLFDDRQSNPRRLRTTVRTPLSGGSVFHIPLRAPTWVSNRANYYAVKRWLVRNIPLLRFLGQDVHASRRVLVYFLRGGAREQILMTATGQPLFWSRKGM